MKYIVQVQNPISGGPVIGEADNLEDAKQIAEDYIGSELIWNRSFTNVVWSDEKDGGETIGLIFHIFEVDNGTL